MKRLVLTLLIVFSSQIGLAASGDLEKVFQQAKKNAVSNLKTRALKQLSFLKSRNYKPAEVHMLMARIYFESNQLEKAIENYNKIPKSSDLWLESLEEKAWAYLRRGQFNKSMEQTLTLLSPVFDQYVNAEVYYLAAVNRYFVCDYNGVFATIQQFKNRYKDRITALERLSSTGVNEDFNNLINTAKLRQINFSSAGPFAIGLPQYHYRDKELKNLYTALNDHGDNPVNSAKLTKLIQKRIQELAEDELKKIKKNIDQLFVVEAEIIQRVYEKSKTQSS
ncbi:MAG: hypothetical protein R2827_07435 [Bdellovibrionales bacterium]